MPYDQAVALELTQRLCQHLLADAAESLAQAGKARRGAIIQRVDHQERPRVGHALEHFVHDRLFGGEDFDGFARGMVSVRDV